MAKHSDWGDPQAMPIPKDYFVPGLLTVSFVENGFLSALQVRHVFRAVLLPSESSIFFSYESSALECRLIVIRSLSRALGKFGLFPRNPFIRNQA
jgi:hypothetical protein